MSEIGVGQRERERERGSRPLPLDLHLAAVAKDDNRALVRQLVRGMGGLADAPDETPRRPAGGRRHEQLGRRAGERKAVSAVPGAVRRHVRRVVRAAAGAPEIPSIEE